MEDDELAAAEPVSPPQPVATARAEFDADLVRGHVTFLAGTCWARITCFLGQFADAIVVEEPLSDLPGGGVEAWSNGETTEQQEVDLELVNKVVEGLPEGVLSCALRPDLLLEFGCFYQPVHLGCLFPCWVSRDKWTCPHCREIY